MMAPICYASLFALALLMTAGIAHAAPAKMPAVKSVSKPAAAPSPPLVAEPASTTAPMPPPPASVFAEALEVQTVVGVIGLRFEPPDSLIEEQANAQVRSTAENITKTGKQPATLGGGKAYDDIQALRAAALGGSFSRVISGLVVSREGDRTLRMLSVSAEDTPPVVAERLVPNLRLEELGSAIEAATCVVMADAGRIEECQGSIALSGALNGVNLFVDKKDLGEANTLVPYPMSVGPHDLELRKADWTSAERRVYVHIKAADEMPVSMDDECRQLAFGPAGQGGAKCGAPWLGIGTAGVGVVAVVVGAIFGSQVRTAQEALAKGVSGGQSDAQVKSLQDDINSKVPLSNGLMIGGGIVAAGGGVLLALGI